jgi:hypothetical protein
MFREEGRSRSEIADVLGCSYSTIAGGLRGRDVHADAVAAVTGTPEGHRLYQLWMSLLARTSDPTHRLYPWAGARGIRVCREWREFPAFYEWSMRTGSKPNLCLARIDSRRGYGPENCRWATRAELQSRGRGRKGINPQR